MKQQLPQIRGFRAGRGPHGLIVPKHAERGPRVALGYPFGGSVTWVFHESMTRIQRYELSKEQPLLYHLLPQSGLYIDHNRNNIAERFMTTGADWLLQIDSDIEFPATIIETMLEAAGEDKKILGASVPLGPPLPSCAWMMTEQPGIWKSVKTQHWCLAKRGDKVCFGDLALRSGLWNCATCDQSYQWDDERITSQDVLTEAPSARDGLATAVILIHREVLQAIADREGQCWFFKTLQPRLNEEASFKAWTRDGQLVTRAGEVGDGPISDRRFVSVGEDLAFCMRARDAGYQPWCFKMPGLRHHKTLPMSHDMEGPEVQAPAAEPLEVAL